MIRKWIASHEVLVLLMALAIISAITYLPLVEKIGYLNDDWYLMYSAKAYGPGAFIDIFSIDRPARALVMIPLYSVFGGNPLYYSLSGYLFRLLSAFAFLWSLDMLFPNRRRAVFLMSLLFLIYPGFLSQPNAIDYQSHLVGLAAAHLSIALTIKAVSTKRNLTKIISHALSFALGLFALSQMEWYIGFEFFRWGSVFLLASRMGGFLIQKIGRSIRQAFPSLLAPGTFLVWRLFFFHSERGATDVGTQLESAKLSPLHAIYHWVFQVLQDTVDVTFSAWVTPFSQLMGQIRQWGWMLALIVVGVSLYVFYLYKRPQDQNVSSGDYLREAFMLGSFVVLGGLIPIAMANRNVSFPSYSRYSLVSMAGVAIFLGAYLLSMKQEMVRNVVIASLVFVSVLTHHANTMKAVQQTASIRNFWWQVAWRVPQIEKNTTLIANYSGVAIEEDYFVWGPANLIYYPTRTSEKAKIRPGLYSMVLDEHARNKILYRNGQEYEDRRTILTFTNYSNLLLLTQPSSNSCVHVVDGTKPEMSSLEEDDVLLASQYSEIQHVLSDAKPNLPPPLVFGAEPSHTWCFYYEKADLARQRGDWGEVRKLGDSVLNDGLAPEDDIEWLPFLKAYAEAGNVDTMKKIATMMSDADPYVLYQTCHILGSISGLTSDMNTTINSSFCPQ